MTSIFALSSASSLSAVSDHGFFRTGARVSFRDEMVAVNLDGMPMGEESSVSDMIMYVARRIEKVFGKL